MKDYVCYILCVAVFVLVAWLHVALQDKDQMRQDVAICQVNAKIQDGLLIDCRKAIETAAKQKAAIA